MKQVILITGSSSGMGELAAKALARAGHTVYASMRESTEQNAEKPKAFAAFRKSIAWNSFRRSSM
jgi:NAD(P)-dependent dehydrogenase (short-subunit alcohol dehydrogenase family)